MLASLHIMKTKPLGKPYSSQSKFCFYVLFIKSSYQIDDVHDRIAASLT